MDKEKPVAACELRNGAVPGYGTRPLVMSSVSRMPKLQTSDLIVKRPYSAASGAVHLMGNFAPETMATQWRCIII